MRKNAQLLENWFEYRRTLSRKVPGLAIDGTVSVTLFLLTTVLCLLLRELDRANDTSYVAVIFLLDVFLTAMLTEGYFFSVLSAVMSVLAVDYVFTAPYWAVSFVITGFPLTFFVMMFISIATGMIVSRARKAAAVAREAERQRTYADLLRAVSHDIRTPLTGIMGATNVLLEQDGELTEEQRRALLTDAHEDAQWLIRVVENLLSVTRIGGEVAKLNKSWEAPEEVIEGATAKFAKRHPEITVKVMVPDELLLVPMDPLLMQQVLTNLLENAAIHGGGVTQVTISLEKSSEYAVIYVTDNGCGIAKEKMSTLFDGSADSGSWGDMKRNMGIGLSVCRTIVMAHGGSIYAENKETGGAMFRIVLPMEEDYNENQG
ncbi:MAG: PAS domain-containing sensor histidine kinase [Oscillospiraceae bacterium]|nr:PAS domain-containing sensor histidine kinase [Oscillospiraceae bacterium]